MMLIRSCHSCAVFGTEAFSNTCGIFVFFPMAHHLELCHLNCLRSLPLTPFLAAFCLTPPKFPMLFTFPIVVSSPPVSSMVNLHIPVYSLLLTTKREILNCSRTSMCSSFYSVAIKRENYKLNRVIFKQRTQRRVKHQFGTASPIFEVVLQVGL